MYPKFLYKFFTINDCNLGNFKKNQIFLNYPCKFDDPYDSALNIISITEQDVMQLWDLWKEKKTLPNLDLHFDTYSPRWQTNGKPKKEFIIGLCKAAEEGLSQLQQEILNTWGMSCFSAVYDSILMWSHYADGHKGICIEFDANKEPFSNAFRVDYFKKIPRHSYADIIADPAPMQKFSHMFLVKADSWKYQAEWRIIGPKGNIPIKYDKNCISKVFFGIKSSRNNQLDVIKALDVDLERCFIMQNEADEFKIKPLNYVEWQNK